MRGINHVVVGVFALALASSLAPFVRAQSTEVLPPANAAVNGGTGNFIPLGVSSGGAYQVLYEPSQLVGLPIGGRITSIRLRQWNSESSAWPPAAAVCTDYEIRLGTSTRTAATVSTTFANNISGAVLVRDGALNLDANAYPGGAATGTTPEDWGPVIAFSTPYTYTGGPLVIEFRNNGTGAVTHFADAVTPFTAGAALGTTASQTAASGSVVSPLVVLLGIEPPKTEQVTLPNANDTVNGGNGNSIPLGAFTNGRHMSLYAASQFASVPPGSLITGMQLRLRNDEASGWPGADSTNADYEVWLSQSSLTPGTMSDTYASNQLNAVRVRDGALFLPAGAYPAGAASGSTPEPWGPMIAFDTPYVYQGGVLAVDIQSAGGVDPGKFADAVNGSATFSGKTGSPRNTATGFGNTAFVVRLSFVPPVESPFGEGVTKIYALKQFADTPAGSFFQGFLQNADFTTQYLYGPEQFQTVGPGTLLTALSLRNAQTTAWPAALGVYPQFDLRLSKSPLTPGTMSTTVASNSGADAVTVRSGALDVPAGSMAAKPTTGTAAFTWAVPFTQAYSYRSGTLDMLINNQPFPSGTGQVEAFSANIVALQPFGRGKFQIAPGSATVLTSGNVAVARFSADAQVIVPNAVKDGSGFLNFIDTPYADTPKTLQQIIAASELSHIPVGGLITSLSFINSNATAWPGAAGAFADDYNVEISTAANRPESMSVTYAQNAGADALIVRSGPIAWLPGSLPARSTGLYGGTITFDHAFVYKGGDLCVTIRHSGVVRGGASVITGGNSTNNRGVFDNSSKVAESGAFFLVTNAGTIMQLGYIPSGVSPKNVLAANSTEARFVFAPNRAYQMIYDADQIGVPVGATINGVSFRLWNNFTNPFPAADLTLDRFDITMSSATNSVTTMSNTFATNEGADATIVRSGPITIPTAAYPANADSGRRFGLFIPFTRPFVYKGGPITMLLRNGNTSGANSNFEVDAHTVGAIGRRSIASADSTSGSPLGALVARFAFTDDAFCPADLNNDGVVDDLDFQIFVLSYNILDCTDAGMALGCPGDFNFDRIVNDDDFLPFVQAYNAVLCP